ncbi:MAG: hypothetical protein QM790_09215 [Nibricoccus sp.]
MRNLRGYILALVLVAGVGCGFAWQKQRATQLRAEQAQLKLRAAERLELERMRQRYRADEIPAEDLNKLQSEAAEASALRDRITRLKAALTPSPTKSAESPKKQERWHNAGMATPGDTLQSVIWAATGGEVDALVAMLAYAPDTKAAVEAWYASIPPESRALFPTAEKLAATMISARLPTSLSGAEVIEQVGGSGDFVDARVKLKRPSRTNEPPREREVTFRFQRFGSDWHLVVPDSVVGEFVKQSKGG